MCLLAENISGFRVRADLTAGGLLILLLRVACLHSTLTDYREPPFMCQGMLWCDKWPGAKWRFVCLPACQQRPRIIHNTGGGRACRCVPVWNKECIMGEQWGRVAKVERSPVCVSLPTPDASFLYFHVIRLKKKKLFASSFAKKWWFLFSIYMQP